MIFDEGSSGSVIVACNPIFTDDFPMSYHELYTEYRDGSFTLGCPFNL